MVLTAMTASRKAITSSNNSVKDIQGSRQSADACLADCGLGK